MQFHIGAIPETPSFAHEDPWRPIREPGPILMQFFAVPVGIVTGGAVALLWYFFTPMTRAPVPPLMFLLGMIFANIPVHELAHALAHPHFGTSRWSVLGLWPSRLVFYAHYSGELSRNRFLAILGMPLIVISGLPFLVCVMVGNAPATLAFLSVFNVLLSCMDVVGICLILLQVPKEAIVRNQGWRTYWRIPGPASS